MRTLLACLTIALLLGPDPTLADRKSCAALYSGGPRVLGGHRLAEGRNLEKQTRGRGYALAFRAKGRAELTLYFYDDKRRRLSPKDAAIEATANGIVLANILEAGRARDLHLELSDPVVVGKSPFFLSTITGRQQQRFTEQVAVLAYNNCFVKVRYSPVGNSRAPMDRILKEVGRHLAGS